MKVYIHTDYRDNKVPCSCGNEFTPRSTLREDLFFFKGTATPEIYTGKQKIVDSGGRVDKFRRKYGLS